MSNILKTIFGVAGGMQLFKCMAEFSEAVHECREIYDNHIQNLNSNGEIPVTQPKTNKELKNDSVNALVNLGYKVRDSKEKVDHAIMHGGCTTIQDIIKYVLTNSSKNN